MIPIGFFKSNNIIIFAQYKLRHHLYQILFYMSLHTDPQDTKTLLKIVLKFSLNILLFGLLTLPALTQRIPLNLSDPEIGIIEHLGDTIPSSILLIDEDSDTLGLGYLLDKPTIINFVYYRCPGICSPMMSALAETIEVLDLQIGVDYQAFTISFDPTENTELALNKKENYLDLMEDRDIAGKGWKFFTGDSANMALFTDLAGFKYKKVGRDYNHTAALIMLSPEGIITRYIKPGGNQFDQSFYFQPFDVKMSILDAAEGKVRSTINKVLVFCYSYNPEGQQWVFNITKVSGVLIILFGLLFFAFLALRSKLRKQS